MKESAMHSEKKRFGTILAAYAVGALLLASFCARKIAGQQAQIEVPPIPAVVAPSVNPVINPIPVPHIAIPVPHITVPAPEIGPIQAPELNFDLNSELNSNLNADLNSALNADLNSQLNANLNANLNSTLNSDLNSELNLHLAPAISVVVPEIVAATTEDDEDFSASDQETIQKSFTMPASGQKSLDIDNIWGSIEVIADAADKVELTVHRTNRAESKDALEKARKEVTLDISQDAGALKLYVNGPFRCQCDDCRHSHRDDERYVVKMDFQVHVPRDTDLNVRTVNEGHVTIRGTNGSFSVRNVNGDIEMDNISGSGTARTVNGPVKVSFRQNPRENSDFKTINGNVELRFAHDLSADFRFKTFNGAIYSDFPVTARPVQPMEEEHRGTKVIYRADRYTEARVNAGGPQIQIENLNGDIRILENHE
jgi:Putative adhesin